jgi:hypothetical protein
VKAAFPNNSEAGQGNLSGFFHAIYREFGVKTRTYFIA